MDPTGVIRQQFSVPFSYDVAFTHDVFDPGNDTFVRTLAAREPQRRHRVLVAVDSGVKACHPGLEGRIDDYFRVHAKNFELVAPVIAIAGGEQAKNDPGLGQRFHRTLATHRMDRQSFVVIIGGGAVLDAVGFAAATCHRGVRTVRLPTTVLSQNDSGIGVKNGINAFGAKNYLGSFFPPFAVINDFLFLRTLEPRDVVAGYAEAVKVALIRDADFFAWLHDNAERLRALDLDAVAMLIRRCAELHLAHIARGGDPFELGSAKPLDFGHWAAHKLETLTNHRLRHGEAVGIGLRLDSRYSTLAGLLPAVTYDRVERLLRDIGLPGWDDALTAPGPGGAPIVLDGIDEFREHLGGDLTVTMLADIGRGVEVHALDRALILQAIEDLRIIEELRPSAQPIRRGAVGT